MARKTLKAWVKEQMANLEQDGSKVAMFTLYHHKGSMRDELKTMQLGGGKPWDPAEIAEMFQNIADTYASGIQGGSRQQFTLDAIYEGKDRVPESYPFTCAGEMELFGMSSEQPTEKGILSQVLKHNSDNHRITAMQTHDTFEILMRVITMLSNHNEKLTRENYDAVDLAKNMILEKAGDMKEHEIKMFLMKQGLQDRQLLMGMAPGMINSLFGKEIFPVSAADTVLLEKLGESLTREQVAKLAAILDEKQMGMLAPRLVEIEKKKREREAKEKQLEGKKEGS